MQRNAVTVIVDDDDDDVIDCIKGSFAMMAIATTTTTIIATTFATSSTVLERYVDEEEEIKIERQQKQKSYMQLKQEICIIRLIPLKRFSPPSHRQEDVEEVKEKKPKKNSQNLNKNKNLVQKEIEKNIKGDCEIGRDENQKFNIKLARIVVLVVVVAIVVKKLAAKLKCIHTEAEVGNRVAKEQQQEREQQQQQQQLRFSSFLMHARFIRKRFEKYIAIRLQFYKFSFQPVPSVHSRNRRGAMARIARVATQQSHASTRTLSVSQSATYSEADKEKTNLMVAAAAASKSKELLGKRAKIIIKATEARNISSECKIVGKSKYEEAAAAAAPAASSSECYGKNVVESDVNVDEVWNWHRDRAGRENISGRQNDDAFVQFDVGNSKKCGNPLQLSTRYIAATIAVYYMLSRMFCGGCGGGGGLKQFSRLNSRTSSSSQSSSYHNSLWSLSSSLSLSLLLRSIILFILLCGLWQESECTVHSSVKPSINTVKTKYGLLRGIVVRSAPSPTVEAYLGIPYASPPVGSLRFMPPITPSTWKNVRLADRFSPVCPQTVPIPPNGPEALLEVPRARLAQLRRLLPLLKNQSEDCLYLNIYVPYENRRHRRFAEHIESTTTTTTGAKLSTILFIHGESYEWNSGNPYDGSELAAHGNVIVVTINFRLGIFGFLKTGGKESAQGNFGLMDLVAGLHWLKENLPAFGGDPQKITILGHGTGAALANILVVSPVASDLIQQTVLISGSALSPWAIQKNPLLVKRRVAEQTGCHGDMLYYDIAPCLRTKSVAELLAISVEYPRFLVGFAPFIDGTVISPNTNGIGALTLPLGSAIVSTSGIEFANFPKRNLIFCLTSVESYLDLSAQDLEFGFNETRRDRILRTFVRNNYHYHLNEIFAVLKNEYTDWEKAVRNPMSSRDATLSFLSDGHTASSLIKLAYMHSLRGGRSFFLHFKHKTMEEEYPQRTGSVRGEDVPFWLGLPVSPLFPHNYTAQEKQISRLMLRYLANFAKTGNPNQSMKSSSPMPLSSTSISALNVSPQQPPPQNIIAQSNFADSSQRLVVQSPPHIKFKRASSKQDLMSRFLNITTQQNRQYLQYTGAAAAAKKQALDLAIIYNQRRSNAMRDKRAGHKRHLRSNDDLGQSGGFDNDLPFWDAYDVVNQLYLELGNKVEVLSHYRGHKLSMWLNLIPQLHKHSNINDQSMRHHQFPDDIHNHNLYEGVVRPQLQTRPVDEEEVVAIHAPKPKPTSASSSPNNRTVTGVVAATTPTTTTECGVDNALLITTDLTTQSSNDNRSLSESHKDLATASTGLMGNLEVLRRLSGKQFQSYTTALVATVAVGCFLLILNILIFAGIYHQREKRARDAKTKEELQDSGGGDNSKNSSLMKLNDRIDLDVPPGDVGKTTMIFGEYSCYDEKSKHLQAAAAMDEKLLVELPLPPPPASTVKAAMHDTNWAACSSTSTLDLLKTKHHHHHQMELPTSNIATVPTTLLPNESSEVHLHRLANMEMATFHPISIEAPISTLQQHHSRRSSFAASAANPENLNLNHQFDYAVQSSDQMSFKDIENAVKGSTAADNITNDIDDDIPDPPPPPRSFQQQQQQKQPTAQTTSGGILRQSGSSSVSSTNSGKKRVHIQEISV